MLEMNLWECLESNPELLGAKRECYPLCYVAPINIWVLIQNSHQKLALELHAADDLIGFRIGLGSQK